MWKEVVLGHVHMWAQLRVENERSLDKRLEAVCDWLEIWFGFGTEGEEALTVVRLIHRISTHVEKDGEVKRYAKELGGAAGRTEQTEWDLEDSQAEVGKKKAVKMNNE